MKVPTRLLLILIPLLALISCGVDDSTPQARLEEAKIALDAQNWDRAIAILTDFCGTDPANPACDFPTRTLLASAHMGRGGLDLINVIRNAPSAQTAVGTVDPNAFKAISTSLGEVTDPDRADFRVAITLLNGIPTRTGDQNLQLAIIVAADLIGLMAKVSGGFDVLGRPTEVPTVEQARTILTDLQGDLSAIKSVVVQLAPQLAPDNRILDTIDQVSRDLDADGNGTLTEAEIQAYITKVRGS